MPKIRFQPLGTEVDVDAGTKILVAARRAKIDIRYGCGACRCGTCGVKVRLEEGASLSEMGSDESKLLARIGLSTGGDVRLTCRTKVQAGVVEVDLSFQDTYTPTDIDWP